MPFKCFHHVSCIAIIMAFGFPGDLYATPISALNLGALCDKSDLIVIGKVGFFRNVGEAELSTDVGISTVTTTESSVEIVGVLKGSSTTEKIRVRTPLSQSPGGSIGLDGIPTNSVRLLFLKRSGGGSYEVVDPYYPSLPATLSLTDGSLPILTQVANVECAVVIDRHAQIDERLKAIWSLRRLREPCIIQA